MQEAEVVVRGEESKGRGKEVLTLRQQLPILTTSAIEEDATLPFSVEYIHHMVVKSVGTVKAYLLPQNQGFLHNKAVELVHSAQ